MDRGCNDITNFFFFDPLPNYKNQPQKIEVFHFIFKAVNLHFQLTAFKYEVDSQTWGQDKSTSIMKIASIQHQLNKQDK